MGAAIDCEEFCAEDHARFADKLESSLEALRELLARPRFGEGEPSIGAELEMHLVDAAAQPMPVNEAVQRGADDPRVTLEINRFNLEINSSPCLLADAPFATLERELEGCLARLRNAAAAQGARVALVGTLPTLRAAQLGASAMTDQPRYRALGRALKDLRGAPFEVRIDGRESLRTHCDDVTLEGANASLQVHLSVPVASYANHYNAAQLAAGPLLAACGNSPFFDARSLWEETRIALFKQAVDTRVELDEDYRLPARVTFGYGYIRDAWQPFAENVGLYVPLLPVCSSEDPLAVVRSGGVPSLEELRLHHGTVWNWNRAVFDPTGGGHMRIEHRVLPSGPTVRDMMANAAFALGLTLGLAEGIERRLAAFPFAYAERNLYRAARHGLAAELLWPPQCAPSPTPMRAQDLVLELLPLAERGLVRAGVAAQQATELLQIIRERVETGRTGAAAQRRMFEAHHEHLPREEALAAMLQEYMRYSDAGEPVHRWSVWDA